MVILMPTQICLANTELQSHEVMGIESVVIVPEPTTIFILVLGGILIMYRYRRHHVTHT